MKLFGVKLLALLLIFIFDRNDLYSQTFNWKPNQLVSLDTIKGKLLLDQCSRNPLPDFEKVFELSRNNLDLLRQNFGRIYNIADDDLTSVHSLHRNLKEYNYQTIGVRIDDMDFIYISAFDRKTLEESEEDMLKQLKEPIIMCDGGDLFWGVLYCLDKNYFQTFQFNGRR